MSIIPALAGARDPTLTAGELAAIQAHAGADYPAECCGVVLVRRGAERAARVPNIQDELHAKDPGRFPRTSRTAYYIAHEQLLEIGRREAEGFEVHVIYHSHVDGGYFSETDRRNAMVDGTPAYPSATYVVVGVTQGRVVETRAHRFSAAAGEFVEIPLVVDEHPRVETPAAIDASEAAAIIRLREEERTCLLGPPDRARAQPVDGERDEDGADAGPRAVGARRPGHRSRRSRFRGLDPGLTSAQAPGAPPPAPIAPPVKQPILFSHKIHAGEFKIDCQYCHADARRSTFAGLPSVKRCMGCHQIVASKDAELQKEVEKLRLHWKEGRSIEVGAHPQGRRVRVLSP